VGRRNVDDKPKSLSSTEKQDQPVSPSNTAAPSITEEQAAATAVAAADIVALPSERADDEGAAEESTEEGSVGLRRRIVAPSPPAPVPELKKPEPVPPAVEDKSTLKSAQA